MKRNIAVFLAAFVLTLVVAWVLADRRDLVYGVPDELANDPMIYTEWETWNEEDGLPHHIVYGVKALSKTEVWACTDNGVAVFDGSSWKAYGVKDGLPHRAVFQVAVDDEGNKWFATLGGLSKFDGKTFTNYTDSNSGLINDTVYGVTYREGEIWACTTDGVGRYNIKKDTWTGYHIHNAPMDEVWCYGIDSAPGKIWMGIWGNGLMEYDLARDHFQAYRDPDGSFTVDLFKNDGMLTMMATGAAVAKDGAIWASSYFGMARYDGKRWLDWNMRDSGLASNFLNNVYASDTAGWGCTDKGLSGTDLRKFVTYQVEEGPTFRRGKVVVTDMEGGNRRVYYTRTHIPHNFVWSASFKDDEVWVGTSDGVARGRRKARL